MLSDDPPVLADYDVIRMACDRAGIAVRLLKPMTSGAKLEGRFGKQDFSCPARPPCGRSDRALAAPAPRRMMPTMADLLLRRAPAAPGEVYDVLSGSRIVGRILLSGASAASQWVWTLSYDYHEDRTPTHGDAATRDAALQAFTRIWNRET
jgi:hypothetical protein